MICGDFVRWKPAKTREEMLSVFAFCEWLRAVACLEAHNQPSLGDVCARLGLDRSDFALPV